MPSYNYLYRITNLKERKHYYGTRTSKNVLPSQDLGIRYFSTSYDKEFINDQQIHPENYRYKVIVISDSIKKIVSLEIKLHNKFKVSTNPNFYNKSIQTSTSFNTSGRVAVHDKNGNCFSTVVDDPKYISGEYLHTSKGLCSVKDKDGNCFQVSKDDPRYISGELVGVRRGLVSVIDENGKRFTVAVNDPRYLSGELIHHNKGKGTDLVMAKDKNGNFFRVPKNDPRYVSGELFSIMKGLVCVKDKEGNYFQVPKNDPRYLSGELSGPSKGTKYIHNLELKTNKRIGPNEPLPDGWNFGYKTTWD